MQDVDLQVLANGLWASGAEAIAINGARLTSTTAIRSAGAAVLVDMRPIVSPFTVEAIGDAVGLQTGLARGAAGQRLAMLRSQYRIGVDVTAQDRLRLPASGSSTLHVARVLEEPTASSVPEGAGEDGGDAGEADALGAASPDVAVSVRPDGGEGS
ncbi:DUF881 domain-containing protein [Cellulomonas sp. JZ18]|uniref:DUF881 domain-containing protein n=1 Tax=Cellulomonas sp. JZ18 TaxID=2654191 RepID=UPI0018AFF75D